MKSLSGREFGSSSVVAGSCFASVGSHHIYGKTGRVVRLSIPIHGNKPLKIGLLRHLAKLAEILEEDL
jgi:hypothetical protein